MSSNKSPFQKSSWKNSIKMGLKKVMRQEKATRMNRFEHIDT
jgi:hypothetical protein